MAVLEPDLEEMGSRGSVRRMVLSFLQLRRTVSCRIDTAPDNAGVVDTAFGGWSDYAD